MLYPPSVIPAVFPWQLSSLVAVTKMSPSSVAAPEAELNKFPAATEAPLFWKNVLLLTINAAVPSFAMPPPSLSAMLLAKVLFTMVAVPSLRRPAPSAVLTLLETVQLVTVKVPVSL
jgi:hypothetical protein